MLGFKKGAYSVSPQYVKHSASYRQSWMMLSRRLLRSSLTSILQGYAPFTLTFPAFIIAPRTYISTLIAHASLSGHKPSKQGQRRTTRCPFSRLCSRQHWPSNMLQNSSCTPVWLPQLCRRHHQRLLKD